MSEDTRTAEDVAVEIHTGNDKACEVCCRVLAHAPEAVAIGYLPARDDARTVGGYRISAATCGDCMSLVLAGDWAGLEALVFDYMTSDWTRWDRLVDPFRRRPARRTARSIAAMAASLFGHLTRAAA